MKILLNEIGNIKNIEEAKLTLFQHIERNEQLEKAVDFSIKAHEHQKRKSGEPYVIHPILVASIVAKISGDKSMVIAGLLHDVVEDTKYTLEDIEKRFDSDVSYLVDGLTKIDSIREKELAPSHLKDKLSKTAFSFRKMLTASIKDMRILIIKLCDRIHNLSTLDALPEKKQVRIAEESLVVYAPIAHRLGISSLKSLIEDFSFKYLFRSDFDLISEYIDKYDETFRIKLHNFKKNMNQELIKNGFAEDDFEIKSRIKHKYSIYRKMQRKGINIDEVLDLLAIRIIVKNPIDSYKVLGIIHLNFKPLTFRFKDYIASQKENGYQTLHTTVLDKSSIFEVQIRTFEMDKTAEYGLAAHWKYKQVTKVNTNWIEKLDSKDIDIGDYCDLIKGDLFSEEVTVYSPNFDSVTLPLGSVALDFAYAIHSDLGNRSKFAYVNKKKVSLLTELKSGDVVNIVAGDKNIPRCSWFDSVKTHHSQKEMKSICKSRIREIDTQVGYNILSTIFKLSKPRIIQKLDDLDIQDLISKVPNNEATLKNVVNKFIDSLKYRRLFATFRFHKYKLKSYRFKSLKVYSNLHISETHFDVCCHPNSGDDVLGVLEYGKVSIHHKMCSQISNTLENNKMVFVEWDSKELKYQYNLIVSISNHRGALAEFLKYLAKLNIDILSIKSEKDTVSNDYTLYFELEIESKEKNIDKIKKELEHKIKVIQITLASDSYKK